MTNLVIIIEDKRSDKGREGRRLVQREAFAEKRYDIRSITLYPALAAALLFVLIRYVIIPANIAFVERLSVTVLAVTV